MRTNTCTRPQPDHRHTKCLGPYTENEEIYHFSTMATRELAGKHYCCRVTICTPSLLPSLPAPISNLEGQLVVVVNLL